MPLDGVGRVLQGKSWVGQNIFGVEPVSGTVGNKPFPNVIVRYVPGIMTTPDQAKETAQFISESLGRGASSSLYLSSGERGGLDFHVATCGLPEEIRSEMIVASFGSAKMLSDND